MNARTPANVPAPLLLARRRLDRWRSRQPRRTRLPKDLWQEQIRGHLTHFGALVAWTSLSHGGQCLLARRKPKGGRPVAASCVEREAYRV